MGAVYCCSRDSTCHTLHRLGDKSSWWGHCTGGTYPVREYKRPLLGSCTADPSRCNAVPQRTDAQQRLRRSTERTCHMTRNAEYGRYQRGDRDRWCPRLEFGPPPATDSPKCRCRLEKQKWVKALVRPDRVGYLSTPCL